MMTHPGLSASISSYLPPPALVRKGVARPVQLPPGQQAGSEERDTVPHFMYTHSQHQPAIASHEQPCHVGCVLPLLHDMISYRSLYYC